MRTDPLNDMRDASSQAELRQALYRAQESNRKLREKHSQYVIATVEACKDATLSLGPIAPVPAPARDSRRKAKPEVALWHLTDWQGGKITASYNGQVMRERVMRFCEKAVALTEIQRAHHPVRKCMIMFGGDLIEGLFQYPAQAFQVDASLFGQYTRAVRLVIDVVRYALANYDEVEVIGEWGNHGRIGSKRSEVPTPDNFDRMIQWTARELLTLLEPKRLTWEDPAGQLEHVDLETEDGRFLAADIQRVQVGNYRALLIHGDEIGRNGHASPMTIVNHVAKWQSGSYPWQFRDCYLGHYHNHCEWALPNGIGAVYQTGAPESDNRYAGVNLAASATPSQRLHFIDPEKGRVTAQFKVFLDA